MIRYGFQTYTWQMSYDKYAGRIEHIADIASRGGIGALEAEICMLGGYFGEPERLCGVLSEKNMELGALCLVCDWIEPKETDGERALADKAMAYLKHFPKTLLALGQMPQPDRSELAARQKNALACINGIAKRAYDMGIASAFHPNSPAGSVFRTYGDYQVLLGGLDRRYLGFAPDSGHIIKGGMDVYEIFSANAPIIKHVHFKDIDEGGTWRVMGEGMTDFARIAGILNAVGFDGYIMVEDESPEAELDPDAVALQNAGYIAEFLR